MRTVSRRARLRRETNQCSEPAQVRVKAPDPLTPTPHNRRLGCRPPNPPGTTHLQAKTNLARLALARAMLEGHSNDRQDAVQVPSTGVNGGPASGLEGLTLSHFLTLSLSHFLTLSFFHSLDTLSHSLSLTQARINLERLALARAMLEGCVSYERVTPVGP